MTLYLKTAPLTGMSPAVLDAHDAYQQLVDKHAHADADVMALEDLLRPDSSGLSAADRQDQRRIEDAIKAGVDNLEALPSAKAEAEQTLRRTTMIRTARLKELNAAGAALMRLLEQHRGEKAAELEDGMAGAVERIQRGLAEMNAGRQQLASLLAQADWWEKVGATRWQNYTGGGWGQQIIARFPAAWQSAYAIALGAESASAAHNERMTVAAEEEARRVARRAASDATQNSAA